LTSPIEGLPAIIIKAILAEKCVISTEVGDISNTTKQNNNEFLFKNKKILYSIQLILKLLNDNELLERIAQKG